MHINDFNQWHTHTHSHASITLIIINDNVRSHTSTTNACNAYLEFGMGIGSAGNTKFHELSQIPRAKASKQQPFVINLDKLNVDNI